MIEAYKNDAFNSAGISSPAVLEFAHTLAAQVGTAEAPLQTQNIFGFVRRHNERREYHNVERAMSNAVSHARNGLSFVRNNISSSIGLVAYFEKNDPSVLQQKESWQYKLPKLKSADAAIRLQLAEFDNIQFNYLSKEGDKNNGDLLRRRAQPILDLAKNIQKNANADLYLRHEITTTLRPIMRALEDAKPLPPKNRFTSYHGGGGSGFDGDSGGGE